MEIELPDHKTIGEVQAEFMAFFPYLKPVFFSKPHREHRGSNAKFLLNDRSLAIGGIRAKGHGTAGCLYFDEGMTVWQLESLLETEFGLHAQVFRKSGDQWLETSVTDHLDLAAQNAMGEASANFTLPIGEPMDYREQD